MKRLLCWILSLCLLLCLVPGAAAAERVTGTLERRAGYDLASVRCELADGSYFFASFEETPTGYAYAFDCPAGTYTVKPEYFSTTVWDGAVDISWYDASQTVFSIDTPAKLAGLAALVNGQVDAGTPDYRIKGDRSELVSTRVDDYLLVGAGGDNQYGTVHVGDAAHDFSDKTVCLTADLDMGGSSNWTPIGGLYPMDRDNTERVIVAYFNGTLDGQGHRITNLFCDRYAEKGYAYSQGVGLIGHMGDLYDGEAAPETAPAVRNLSVSGSIYGRRMVGGIVGQEELGLVTACESYGDVTGVNQVGGIAGAASAKLRSNWAKCALSGEKYIGGIVGQGTDSDLTDGSLIAINNRAIVSVLEGQQYVGAVSGGQDGDFYGNLFVSDDLQGIDRLSRVGQAEPVTYETLLAQENVPDSFRKLNLTFKADGHIIKKISFDYGASFTLDDYPEIPQKNGYYAEWSTPVLDQLHTDTVVNVEYTPYIPSLSSSVTRENGRPVFFVDGFFGGSNAVQVTQQDITADVHGVTEQWLLEFTDDGNETHQIRYLTPGKAKGKVYVKQADGSWHKVETGSFGSYTTFTTTGTEVEVAFVPAKLPVWAFCAGGAALLVLLLLLAKRIKSKHGPKGEKPLKEKKGKQPETVDTPTDELDTPISETDMQ